jgi:predicted extracellular nuclease
MSKSLMIALCIALSSGCTLPKTTSDDSDTGAHSGGGSSPAGGASIYDIQMGEYAEGSVLTIHEAVVTTQLTDGENPAFFIQSKDGGAYNGLYVFKYDEVEYTPTPGDVISITGEYTEYYGNSQLKVIESGAIVVTDSDADVVLTDLTEEPENWEAYESVMVRFTDMEITSAENLYTFGTVDLAIGCSMDNLFTNYDAEDGAFYSSIVGPITFGWDIFTVVPRSADDLAGYTGTIGGSGGGSGGGGAAVDGTVAEVQMGDINEGSIVTLSGVVATSGLNYNEDGFFIQDADGGEYSGVYVYLFDEALEGLADVAAGDVLNITGAVTEFFDLTEISVSSADDIQATGDTAATVVDQLDTTPSDWEAWEGCLVELADVNVTSDEDDYGAASTNHGAMLDDDLFSFDVSDGDSFSAVTGLVTFTYSEYRLLPRSAADMAD